MELVIIEKDLAEFLESILDKVNGEYFFNSHWLIMHNNGKVVNAEFDKVPPGTKLDVVTSDDVDGGNFVDATFLMSRLTKKQLCAFLLAYD